MGGDIWRKRLSNNTRFCLDDIEANADDMRTAIKLAASRAKERGDAATLYDLLSLSQSLARISKLVTLAREGKYEEG